MSLNKTCRGCCTTKPITDFYLHPQMKDGHLNFCKACRKTQERLHRRTNPEVQARERARAKRPERKQRARLVTIKWRQEHPEAYRAQNAVNNAVRDQRLKKEPCAMCGAAKHVHGHHKDYSKPLEVTWLCAKCHHRIHAAFPELGGHQEAAE